VGFGVDAGSGRTGGGLDAFSATWTATGTLGSSLRVDDQITTPITTSAAAAASQRVRRAAGVGVRNEMFVSISLGEKVSNVLWTTACGGGGEKELSGGGVRSIAGGNSGSD